MKSFAVGAAYFVIPLLIALAAWQLLIMINPPSPFFPAPLAIFGNVGDLLFDGFGVTPVFINDLLGSLGRIVLGFAIGAIWGTVVGTLIGLHRAARETVSPIVEFLRSIPATATLPLFIILLGGGDDMRVAFIAYGASWFVMLNTASGVASIHQTMLDMGKIFRISRTRQLFRIILPAAMPEIFAGLRIASTAALLLAIVSEFLLSTNGIGHQLIQAQGRFRLLDMWSWMVILAVLGLLMNILLELIEQRVLGWHRASRART